jgi:arylsulfatase A-like enzyme
MSFLKVFRIIFVVFSLYLLGDIFYRWDGFRYYGNFSEFIPAIALASILWSIVAILTSLIIWILLKSCTGICKTTGLNIKAEHLVLYGGIFLILGALAWKGKKLLWSDVHTSIQIKLLVFAVVLFFSLFLTLLFRNRAEQWIDIVHKRITPLVWSFGIFVLISLPIVVYHSRLTQDEPVKESSVKPYQQNRPNIILITFDALSAREMSLYGYHRKTTPFIDEWSKKATVFKRVEAASNFTTPATASLMTGKRVWTHKTFHLEGSPPINSKTESLPALLKKNGYFNMAFIVNPHTSVKVLGMSDSFDITPLSNEFSIPRSLFGWKFGIIESALYRLFGDKIRLHSWVLQRDFILYRFINLVSRNFDITEAPPDKAINRFLEIIDKSPPEPYFVWIHLFPPHDPYLPPEPFRGYFNPSKELRDYKSQESIRLESFKYLFQYVPFPPEMEPSISLLRDYYDEFLRYCDKHFEDFIKELEKRNALDSSIIILSSDHGESFEHGYFTHGGPFLYEQVTHIPLIIKEPRQKEGKIINALVEQIDIPATILDFAGINIPSWMEGRSLVPLIRGESLPPKIAFSMFLEENSSYADKITKGTIAVWSGDYKLIHYIDKKESLLFNLKKDYYESNNLFNEDIAVSKQLLRSIEENLENF